MAERQKFVMLGSCSAIALSAFVVTAPGVASAAAEGSTTANQVEEVVVTANKREQRLIDVSAAVSAVKGEDLMNRNILQVEDLATQTPALAIQSAGNRATRVILRGLNSGGAGATIATVIDEAVLSYSSGTSNGAIDIANLDTYDLSRIEVLRGPQGTLYGAAAEGGIIKYVTNAPNLTKMEGGAEGEVESVDQGGIGYTVRGFVNAPLATDHVALRLTGFYKQIEGYVDNPLINRDDANNGHRYGGRAQLLIQATPDLSLRLAAFIQNQSFNDDGQVQVKGAAFTAGNPPADQFDVLGDRLQHNELLLNPSKNSTKLYSAVIKWEPAFADVLSATSYGAVDTVFSTNITDYPLVPGFTYGDLFGSIYGEAVNLPGRQQNKLGKFNEELRISSKPNSQVFGMPVDWQGGIFYSHEDVTFNQFYDARSVATGQLLTVPLPVGGSFLPATYDEVSEFANATLHFTPQFNIAVGGRYSESWQTSQVTSFAGLLNGPVDTINPELRPPHEKRVTWSVAPQFRFNDNAQVYARVATGFRPGGPELLIPGAPPDFPVSYKADSTTNYEVGFKGQLLDGRVSVDVAAFYIDWTDIQIITQYTSTTSGQVFNVTGNAGQAVSQGFEWNLGFVPIDGLTLGFTGSYVDAHLTQDAPFLGGVSGDKLTYVPDWTVTLNADYRWPISQSAEAFVGGSVSYVGKRYGDFSAVPFYENHPELPTYTTFSLRAGVEVGQTTFQVFGNNLSNERGVMNYTNIGGYANTGLIQILQPRSFGARIGVTF